MGTLRRLLLLLATPLLPGPAAAQFIYYDSDNSRLYSTNNFYSAGDITSANYGEGGDVYASNGWLVNTSGGAGLYNETLGTHFYADSGYWTLNASRLFLRNNHEGTVYGSIYSDGSSFGVLNNAGSWALYSTGGSQVVNFPGSIQIGTYGGILDVSNYFIYGSIALDTAKGGYYGVLFGPNNTYYNLMFDGSGNGGYYNESGGYWRDYYTKSSRTWDINATVYANDVYSDGYQALTKVAYVLYCVGGNNYCDPPVCPTGAVDGGSVYGGPPTGLSGYTKYRVCCWGNN